LLSSPLAHYDSEGSSPSLKDYSAVYSYLVASCLLTPLARPFGWVRCSWSLACQPTAPVACCGQAAPPGHV